MLTDPISDLLARIRNGSQRRHDVISVPASKLKRGVLDILVREGYIDGVENAESDGHPIFKVRLRYVDDAKPMITGLQRISKPGRRVYVGSGKVAKVRNGIGMTILSTSKGIMTDQESRSNKIGGEVLCSIW